MSSEKVPYYDEKDPDGVYVRPAYDDNAVDRMMADRDEDLAHATEGDHGTKRALPPRVCSMIAIAGTIGTGLFLGSGSALAQGGPVGCFLGYLIMGTFIGLMMYCLGEMLCFRPTIGGFVEMGAMYVSPSFGFMMGFTYALKVGLSVPSEMSAIAVLIGFWDKNTKHAGIYITVFLLLTVGVNMLGVRWYGEVEFTMAIIKVGMLLALIIFGLIANLGGVPGHRQFTGGKYWRDAPFNDTYRGVAPRSLASFLGFFSVLIKASFSFAGIECVGLLAGEAQNPRRTLRTCIRTIFYRIGGLYVISIIIIGLNVRYDDPDLLSANELGGSTAAASPFVLIAKRVGVPVLAHIINAVVVTSAWSAGNESLYGLSRCLMGMTRNGFGFKCFLSTSKQGVPWVGVAIGGVFGLLGYLSLSDGSAQAFNWLSDLTGLFNLVNWASICFCFIRFKKACDRQGVNRHKFILRAWFQPYCAYAAITCFLIVLVFSGFKAFVPVFEYKDFLANYISIPVVLFSWLGWWLYSGRGGLVPIDEIDLSEGPAAALIGTKYTQQEHILA